MNSSFSCEDKGAIHMMLANALVQSCQRFISIEVNTFAVHICQITEVEKWTQNY